MMTLRIGPGRGNSPRCRDRGCSIARSAAIGRHADRHREVPALPATRDHPSIHHGRWSPHHHHHHCAQHGDVIPVHGVIMHDE